MAQINVIAQIWIKEESLEQLKPTLNLLVTETRKEKGCLYYDLYQSLDDEKHFIMNEKWETSEDLGAHMLSDHFKKCGTLIGAAASKPIEIIKMK
jgi:quinol monooxygenase YgiN